MDGPTPTDKLAELSGLSGFKEGAHLCASTFMGGEYASSLIVCSNGDLHSAECWCCLLVLGHGPAHVSLVDLDFSVQVSRVPYFCICGKSFCFWKTILLQGTANQTQGETLALGIVYSGTNGDCKRN